MKNDSSVNLAEWSFWIVNLILKGSKAQAKSQNSFGPILWTMHTLSGKTLRIMAQMPPIGAKDNQKVELFLKLNNSWKNVATQPIDNAAYTAHFSIPGWDSAKDIAYRVVYKNPDGSIADTATAGFYKFIKN